MPTAVCDGIETSYEVVGSGPPLLMAAPGGFNAVGENWRSLGIYSRLHLVEHLSERHRCIVFDRREAGRSAARLERLSWPRYAAQAAGLLDHLGIERANVIGGCAGCSVVLALAVAHPGRVDKMVLFSPAGGPRYRLAQHERFARHLAYVTEAGLDGVVALATGSERSFSEEPRLGPWAGALRRDAELADAFVRQDPAGYRVLVAGSARALFDRDTVPGAEPEDLLRLDVPALIVPGHDASHATSAARYLEECLSRAEYFDVPVEDQTEANVPGRILDFLDVDGAGAAGDQ